MKTKAKMVACVLVLSNLLVAGHCEPNPPVDPTQTDGGSGAGGSSGTIDEQCAAACENMRTLSCPGYSGQPVEDGGSSCETTCVANEVSTVAHWCPVQVSQATDCDSLEAAWESCD